MPDRCHCKTCSHYRAFANHIVQARKLYVVGQLAKYHVESSLLEDSEDDCCICLEPLSKEEYVCHLGCNHYMHSECLARWFFDNPSCPQCRMHPESLATGTKCIMCIMAGTEIDRDDYMSVACCNAELHHQCFVRFMNAAEPEERNCPMCKAAWDASTLNLS
jgi:hypothetical protein